MSKRTYEEYIKNDCHPVGYNEPCQSYFFGQTSVDLLLDRIDQLKQQLVEKDKEIEDLKEWQDWYSMRHKSFLKQIEDLTTELETYRPTKLHGEGQCECYKCQQEGRQPRKWTDWCSSYKGHIYCDDCLKEILKEEQTTQALLAIQELEKVHSILTDTIIEVTQDESDLNRLCYLEEISAKFFEKIQQQISELKDNKKD